MEWAMIVIVDKDPNLEFAVGWMNPHIEHELRSTMDLASVIVTLGVVQENQVSTSGTIKILREAAKYRNMEGVSLISSRKYFF